MKFHPGIRILINLSGKISKYVRSLQFLLKICFVSVEAFIVFDWYCIAAMLRAGMSARAEISTQDYRGNTVHNNILIIILVLTKINSHFEIKFGS